MPAWNDADGGITFCAETEVGIRCAVLRKKEEKKNFLGIYFKSDYADYSLHGMEMC